MNALLILTSLLAAFRMATPLVFASLGGYFSERSGVINIALEGLMLMGAFVSGAVAASTHSPFIGLIAGIGIGVFLAAVYAFMVIEMQADQIIAGIAVNLFALGMPPVICKAIYDVSGGTPMLQASEKMPSLWGGSLFVWGIFPTLLIVHLMHSRTRFGQHVRFSGEHPHALISQGISVKKIRWTSVLLSGAFCGIAGAYLSIDHGSGFTRSMTAGRGFIALAALIIGRWTPIGAFLASLVFGLIETSQILLQGMQLPNGMTVPVQWIQMVPYIATLIILAGLFGKKWGISRPPKNLGAALSLVLLSSIALTGCNWKEKTKPVLEKIFPSLFETDEGKTDRTNADDYIAPPNNVRKLNADFIKELFKDTLTREPSSEEATRLMTVLDQGAHFEGIYNGIIYSIDYKVKEKGRASVAAIKIYAEILTRLKQEQEIETASKKNSEINMDQELPKTEILKPGSTDTAKVLTFTKEETAKKIEEFKQETVFNELSFCALKRILGEEMLKTIDLKKAYKEKLATFFGKNVIFLNQYGADFGIAQRNKNDETYHYRWALYSEEDRIKWEMLHRIHVIFNTIPYR